MFWLLDRSATVRNFEILPSLARLSSVYWLVSVGRERDGGSRPMFWLLGGSAAVRNFEIFPSLARLSSVYWLMSGGGER